MLTKTAVPFSIAHLINGQSSTQALLNIIGSYSDARSQVEDTNNVSAIMERQAYWIRWMNFVLTNAPQLQAYSFCTVPTITNVPVLVTSHTNAHSRSLVSLSPSVVPVTLFLDTIDVEGAYVGWNGQTSAALSVAGVSFHAPNGITKTLSIIVPLSADDNTDAGSVQVWLVPDDGSGESEGVVGRPTVNVDVDGNFVSFANSQLIATIADTALPLTPNPKLFNFTAVSTITTLNNEYWVFLLFSPDSSGECYYPSSINDVADQAVAYVQYNQAIQVFPDVDSGGTFQFLISQIG